MVQAKPSLIEVQRVSHVYPAGHGAEEQPSAGGRVALAEVSMTVGAGEFVAVLGANGSGKSTLAKHLNALLLPTTGRVLVQGLDTRDRTNLWQVRQKVGMVFQNPDNQLVAATVEEDAAFGPENLGLPPSEVRRRVEAALAAVGLQDLRHRPTHFLSGGQKQRLAVAGVLAMEPECLVLDEATAMLDPQGRHEVLRTVKDLHQRGLAVVWVTHFMEEAVAADRLVILAGGRVAMSGTPREVFADGIKLASLGLELPDIAALGEELAAGGLSLPLPLLDLEEMVSSLCPYWRWSNGH